MEVMQRKSDSSMWSLQKEMQVELVTFETFCLRCRHVEEGEEGDEDISL